MAKSRPRSSSRTGRAPRACLRNQIIEALWAQLKLTTRQIASLRLADIATRPLETGAFVECRSVVLVGSQGAAPRAVPLTPEIRSLIEDYVNLSHPDCPFTDYRPDIGKHLFPSARSTATGITPQAVNKLLRCERATNTDASETAEKEP